jgi:lipoprotein NlpD
MMSDIQILVAILFTFLCSCTSSVAPVDSRQTGELYRPAPVNNYDPEPVINGFHEVVRGDTLYSISFRYGLDYRDVASWNNISGRYIIYPGQRIRLIPNTNDITTGQSPLEQQPVPSNTQKRPIDNSSPSTPPADAVNAQQNIKWGWPTEGRIIKFDSPIAQKGLDITGTAGQDIQAAAEGLVVYSGSGLLGYGKLIIIKHNETFLSAYAHNQIMLVKEGDRVNAGQKIGTMGKGNKGLPLLHFEIRKQGKPMDPLQVLPVRS